ncbi:hypothetical protein Tco_1470088 [Tanacetum coccineum]
MGQSGSPTKVTVASTVARSRVIYNLLRQGSEDQLSAKHQLAVKGLSERKASESNVRCIQVKDIVKEVEDYLKTYSSAGMDISWYVDEIR